MLIRFLPVLMTLLCLPALSSAQEKFPLQLNGGYSFGPAQERAGDPTPDVSARLVQLDALTVELQVKVTPPDEFYIYSMKTDGGQKTKITLTETAGLTPVQQGFTPDHPPKREFSKDFQADVEKFTGSVIWSQQLRSESPLSGAIQISGNVKGQICSSGEGGTCVPLAPPPTFSAQLTADESMDPPEMPVSKAPPGDEPAAEPASGGSVEVLFYQDGADPKTANIRYRAALTPSDAGVGDEVTLSIRAEMKDHWHTYSNTQSPEVLGGSPTRIELVETVGLESGSDGFKATTAAEIVDSPLGDPLEIHSHSVTWQRRFTVTDPGALVTGFVYSQICNDKTRVCEPPGKAMFQLALGKSQGDAVAAVGSPDADDQAAGPVGVAAKAKREGLLGFLLFAMSAGYIALLTPCVFPMIPVTVAFFLKQGESGKGSTKLLAVIYCLGIIGSFTVIGVLASVIFGPETMTELANGPWLNLVFAVVFVAFALMLMGVFEFHVPAFMLNWSAQREGQGGLLGVLFMALTFTLVSFTCTAAFVANLLVLAAKGDYLWPTLGMLAFSTAFASPFFFLALFPGLLAKMPKSGGWMQKVKCTAGLIELAFVVKFLSVADIGFSPTSTPRFVDFSTAMVLWATLAFVTGLYLLGVFRFSKDTPSDGISPIGSLFAMGGIGLALLICIGLISPNPPDNWVWNRLEGFAPPQFELAVADRGGNPYGIDDEFPELAGARYALSHDGLAYSLQLDDAVQLASRRGRPVFIDFTGVNCVNCRDMENNVLNQPEVLSILSTVPRAQLFLDTIPKLKGEEAEKLLEENQKLSKGLTGGTAMPNYLIMSADGEVFSSTSGFVSEEAFLQFLNSGIQRFEEKHAAEESRVSGERPRSRR